MTDWKPLSKTSASLPCVVKYPILILRDFMEYHAKFAWVVTLSINHHLYNNYTSLGGNSIYSCYWTSWNFDFFCWQGAYSIIVNEMKGEIDKHCKC